MEDGHAVAVARPELSVVVLAHDVAPYVTACLDGVAEQSVAADVEAVVVVGDREDATGRLAAAVVARQPRWRLLESPPALGPGAARTAGAAAATGTRLAFLDGTDLLPRRAYERLLRAAARSGSDLVVGGVRRWDGSTLSTPHEHGPALGTPLRRGHVTRDTRLVHDTCLGNKVVLRPTWDAAVSLCGTAAGDDPALAFALHVAARSTDVVTDPVHLQRPRAAGDAPTPWAAGRAGAQQRLAALRRVDELAVRTGVPRLRDAHDAKVVDVDLGALVAALPAADDGERARFVEHAAALVAHVPGHVLAGRDPLRRRVVDAVRAGDLGALLALAPLLAAGPPRPGDGVARGRQPRAFARSRSSGKSTSTAKCSVMSTGTTSRPPAAIAVSIPRSK